MNGIIEIIHESGARNGDLIYVRSAEGVSIPGATLTTAPDLLALKVQAMKANHPLVAVGPPTTDESFADFVIDADAEEPALVKSRTNGRRGIQQEAEAQG